MSSESQDLSAPNKIERITLASIKHFIGFCKSDRESPLFPFIAPVYQVQKNCPLSYSGTKIGYELVFILLTCDKTHCGNALAFSWATGTLEELKTVKP